MGLSFQFFRLYSHLLHRQHLLGSYLFQFFRLYSFQRLVPVPSNLFSFNSLDCIRRVRGAHSWACWGTFQFFRLYSLCNEGFLHTTMKITFNSLDCILFKPLLSNYYSVIWSFNSLDCIHYKIYCEASSWWNLSIL